MASRASYSAICLSTSLLLILAAASSSDISAIVEGEGVGVGFVRGLNNEEKVKERRNDGLRVRKGSILKVVGLGPKPVTVDRTGNGR